MVGQFLHSLNEPPDFGMDAEIFGLLVAQPPLSRASAEIINRYFDFMMPPYLLERRYMRQPHFWCPLEEGLIDAGGFALVEQQRVGSLPLPFFPPETDVIHDHESS